MERYFLGNFNYAIDSQRRVPLHKDWRAGETPPTFVLLPGRNKTIHAMPEELFREVMLDKAKRVSIADAQGTQWLARIGGAATITPVDKQGRIKLSPHLMEHAGLTDQAVMVGGMTTIQIMSPETWGDTGADILSRQALAAFLRILAPSLSATAGSYMVRAERALREPMWLSLDSGESVASDPTPRTSQTRSPPST